MGETRSMGKHGLTGGPCRRYPAELVTVCPVIQPSGQRCNVQGHESTPTTFSKIAKRTTFDVPHEPGVDLLAILSPTPDTFGM